MNDSRQEDLESLKTRLENDLYRGRKKISPAVWNHLIRAAVVDVYQYSSFNDEASRWSEFKETAKDNIELAEMLIRDASSEPRTYTSNSNSQVVKSSIESESQSDEVDNELATTSDVTLARAEALHVRDQAYSNDVNISFLPAASAAYFASGQYRKGHPQWIVLIHAPVWVSADVIKNLYRSVQKELTDEPLAPKTQERTYKLVRFVWDLEQANNGIRPKWKTLMEEWNAAEIAYARRYKALYAKEYKERLYDDFRAFRRAFLAGEEATMPNYKSKLLKNATISPQYDDANEMFADQLGDDKQVNAFNSWASRFREYL